MAHFEIPEIITADDLYFNNVDYASNETANWDRPQIRTAVVYNVATGRYYTETLVGESFLNIEWPEVLVGEYNRHHSEKYIMEATAEAVDNCIHGSPFLYDIVSKDVAAITLHINDERLLLKEYSGKKYFPHDQEAADWLQDGASEYDLFTEEDLAAIADKKGVPVSDIIDRCDEA